MPLIIVTGYPKSGKTKTARDLESYFQSQEKNVMLVTDELENDKNAVYGCSNKEKLLRGDMKSQAERHLSSSLILILDAPNYIKGYRYELYCMSKEFFTTHCIVHCDVSSEICWERNEKSLHPYSKDVFDGLVQRYEAPNSNARWDSPLVMVFADGNVPFQMVSDALFDKKPPPPNHATQNQPLASTNYLYELDKIAKDLVQTIIQRQKISGAQITLPGADVRLEITRAYTSPELLRHKKAFITYSKMNPVKDAAQIPNLFVKFLNSRLG